MEENNQCGYYADPECIYSQQKKKEMNIDLWLSLGILICGHSRWMQKTNIKHGALKKNHIWFTVLPDEGKLWNELIVVPSISLSSSLCLSHLSFMHRITSSLRLISSSEKYWSAIFACSNKCFIRTSCSSSKVAF